MVKVEPLTLPLDGARVPTVTAAVHHPDAVAGPGVLLAPGAGGDLDGEGLRALAVLFAGLGYPTVRVNLPHQEGGGRGAPRAERSVDAYRQLVEGARAAVAAPGPWIVGGKSYGGRVASMAVAAGMPAAGLVFYGYPLHPPGKPSVERADHLFKVEIPMLFLQGTRDDFAQVPLISDVCERLGPRATLELIEGGDHSFRVSKRASRSGDVMVDLADRIFQWVGGIRG